MFCTVFLSILHIYRMTLIKWREKNKIGILRKLITSLIPLNFEIQSIILPGIESITLSILFWFCLSQAFSISSNRPACVWIFFPFNSCAIILPTFSIGLRSEEYEGQSIKSAFFFSKIYCKFDLCWGSLSNCNCQLLSQFFSIQINFLSKFLHNTLYPYFEYRVWEIF